MFAIAIVTGAWLFSRYKTLALMSSSALSSSSICWISSLRFRSRSSSSDSDEEEDDSNEEDDDTDDGYSE